MASKILLLIAAGLLCVGAWILLRSSGSAPVTPADKVPAAKVEAPGPGSGSKSAVVPKPAQPARTRSRRLLSLPDGRKIRALNGVREPIVMRWPADLPWSPIKGLQTDPDGLQWYVHEDGSRSTTQMVWRSDLGRRVAMSIVANPKEAAPMKGAAEEARDFLRTGPTKRKAAGKGKGK